MRPGLTLVCTSSQCADSACDGTATCKVTPKNDGQACGNMQVCSSGHCVVKSVPR